MGNFNCSTEKTARNFKLNHYRVAVPLAMPTIARRINSRSVGQAAITADRSGPVRGAPESAPPSLKSSIFLGIYRLNHWTIAVRSVRDRDDQPGAIWPSSLSIACDSSPTVPDVVPPTCKTVEFPLKSAVCSSPIEAG